MDKYTKPKMFRAPAPPYRIIYNWDGNPTRYTEHPQSLDELLEKVYAPINDTQIDAHFWAVGQHESTWPSRKFSMVGDSVGRLYETVFNMRHAENMRGFFDRGENPHKAIVNEGKARGVDVWASVRMNDNHLWAVSPTAGEVARVNRGNKMYWLSSKRLPLHPNDFPNTIATGLTKEKRHNPNWLLGDDVDPWAATSWNFAYLGVRKLLLEYITEVSELADWDGLELDWQRHGVYLPNGDEFRLSYVLTDLLRAVRGLTDKISKERGKPFHLAVRIAPSFESCRRIGYNIEEWVNEGLCDVIIPAGISGTDPGIEIEQFRKLIDGTGISLYPCLDTEYRVEARRLHPHTTWRDAWVRGTTAGYWARGVDGICVFNWHGSASTRRKLLTTIGSSETLLRTDKIFAAVHGINAPRGTLRYGCDKNDRLHAETPVTLYRSFSGEGPVFHIQIYGNISEDIDLVVVELQIELAHFSVNDDVGVMLDGRELGVPVIRNVSMEDVNIPSDVDENSWLTWRIKSENMTDGVHQVKISLNERDVRIKSPIVVNHVEIYAKYHTRIQKNPSH